MVVSTLSPLGELKGLTTQEYEMKRRVARATSRGDARRWPCDAQYAPEADW